METFHLTQVCKNLLSVGFWNNKELKKDHGQVYGEDIVENRL